MSFADLLQKNREKQAQKEKLKESVAGTGNRSFLFGTGINKKTAEKAERAEDKIEQGSYSKETLLQANIAADILPDNMMDSNIVLDEWQQAAKDGLKNQKFGCLIGKAGTGKTTVSKAIIEEVVKTIRTIDLNETRNIPNKNDKELPPDLNAALLICSFTGKAVQNIKRALPKEMHTLCDTIHGALGFAPVYEPYEDKETGECYERKVFRPTFTKENKLLYEYVVIDEAGTVQIELWNQLIEALPDHCRILLMGDINQLPPPVGRSVLGFAMAKWPTYYLQQIHRQAEGNSIIENAHRVLEGKMPLASSNFAIVDMPGGSLQTFDKSIAVVEKLANDKKFDPMIDGFLVAYNRETLGQEHFNERLVRFFNPLKKVNEVPINPRITIKAGYQHVYFAVGDKVMATSNDRQRGITNGMIGVVEEISPNAKFSGEMSAEMLGDTLNHDFDIDEMAAALADNDKDKDAQDADENERAASHVMSVKFQNVDEPVTFTSAGEFKKVTHSYAITCHKAQGGEYPTTVILCHSANHVVLSREWLYTAITRGKERVVLMGNRKGILQAIKKQKLKGNTLEEKAKFFINLETSGVGTLPILPDNEEY